MERLCNPVRGYAWGSRAVIARLQGRPVPSPGPEAELWIGAHPADSSTLEAGEVPLATLVAEHPERVLGAPVAARYGARLPYLLKVLAAEAPLSLQAHPDPVQAAAGYAAEEAAGVLRDAPHRRYVDPYHKPELLVAVTEFQALCGFRDPGASARLLAGLGVPALAPVVAALAGGDLAAAARWLLEAPDPAGLVAEAVRAAGPAGHPYRLVGELAAAYPGDVGVVVALLLNEVTLAPGEAIFMPAGNLHAYLRGTGVEIMAASDNVLRGGLTPKYVDVAELVRVLRFEPLPDPVLAPEPVGPGVVTWPVPVPDFVLHRVVLDAGAGTGEAGTGEAGTGEVGTAELALAGPRTVLCLSGEIRAADGRVGDSVSSVTLRSGEAAFGVATAGPLRLTGIGEAYVASVGGPDRTSGGA